MIIFLDSDLFACVVHNYLLGKGQQRKRLNLRLKDVTQTKQRRPESPRIILTSNTVKYTSVECAGILLLLLLLLFWGYPVFEPCTE